MGILPLTLGGFVPVPGVGKKWPDNPVRARRAWKTSRKRTMLRFCTQSQAAGDVFGERLLLVLHTRPPAHPLKDELQEAEAYLKELEETK